MYIEVFACIFQSIVIEKIIMYSVLSEGTNRSTVYVQLKFLMGYLVQTLKRIHLVGGDKYLSYGVRSWHG